MTTDHNLDSIRKKPAFRLRLIIFPVILTSLLIYSGHLVPWGSLELFIIAIGFLSAAAASFVYFPHFTLSAFGVFLILQDILVVNLENVFPFVAPFVKFVDELLILLFFLLVMGGICTRNKIIYKTYIEIPLSIFVIVAITGSLIAEVPFATAIIQLFLYLKGFIFFFTVLQLETNHNIIREYGRFWVIIGLLILVGGLIDLVFPGEFRTLLGQEPMVEQRFGLTSVKSVFIHPGVFGWFFAFLSLYCFGYYMTFNRPKHIFLGVIFSLGSFLSMRRRNLIGISVGLITGLLFQSFSRKLRYGLLFGGTAFIFLILTWPKIENLYRDLFEAYVTLDNPEVIARNALYLTSLTIAEDRFPWGVGLGRFGSWMSQVNYSPVYRQYRLDTIYGLTPQDPKYATDTFWPAILGETGVIGLACFLWICGAIIKQLSLKIKCSGNRLVKAFALGTLMIFLQGLIESFATAIFSGPPAVYFVFGSLGLCFSFSRSVSQ